MDLFLGLLDVPDSIVGSSELVVSEIIKGFSEMGLKLIKLDEHSLNGRTSVLTNELLKFLFTSGVIDVVVTSVSSGHGLFGELLELFESVVLEHMSVGEESVVRWHVIKFDHRNLTSLMESSELVFEEGDSIHSFIVFSDSQNEDVGSLASLILQSFNEVIDCLESTSDPLEIGSSISDLSLNILSVGDSSVIDTTVGVGNT